MNSKNELTVPKWPFFLADGLFVATAGLALWFAADPIGPGTVVAAVLLLLVGALLSLVPYLLEFYWNWQFRQAEREEQLDLQRQALAKTGSEIAQLVRRWEELDPKPEPGGTPEANGNVAEILEAFRQCQTKLEEHQAKLASRIEGLFKEERETRKDESQQGDQILAALAALRGQLDEWGQAANGSGSSQAPVEEPDVNAVSETADAEEAAPAAPVKKKTAKPVVAPEEPAATPAPKATPAVEAAPESGQVATELEEPPAEKPVVAAKPKKSAKPRVREEEGVSLFSSTTLVATAFIGASNKLFLRGEGPGLSWEEGVPMQFVEIGKWSWTTTEAGGAIRLQVFKNDEEPDKAGVLTLEPGQRLDIRPEFEG